MGTGRSFGTFGELIQGALPGNGPDFLVTLPIERQSVAVFRPDDGTILRVSPPRKGKARTLAARMLRRYGRARGGSLVINSRLPVGKGMASSSADLVATARAVGGAFCLDPSPAAVEDLLREIEPTDGVMHDGMVAFCHREVRLLASLGTVRPLTIVGVDEGGMVDTIGFNRLPKAFTVDDLDEYQSLLAQAACAIEAGDVEALGALATRSAVMNQRLRPKRLLSAAVGLCRRTGALGVVAAHSGTRLGVLLADSDPDYTDKRRRLVAGCREVSAEVSIDHTAPANGRSGRRRRRRHKEARTDAV